jgi:ABC-type polysaccharide/polyol phosphate transport system ATPase subunit
MHSDVAISVKNLSKTYRIFGHPGDRIKQALTFGQKQYHKEFTALKDVSFEIKKGETVGIIGRNGSGKSTLLQLICGILKPTSGSVEVNGRISALLELGAGFNPEFTGRENVYFQGAVMGITREEMARRFEDIAAFADIGEFIDQPVRTYSSGMFVRLAFAAAIHVDPDILIIDEVLAVGDAPFQQKCFDAIHRMQARGTTIIVVSHNPYQIERLCHTAGVFQQGVFSGLCQARETLALYHEMVQQDISPGSIGTFREGTQELSFNLVHLENSAGVPIDTALTLEPLRIVAEFTAKSPMKGIRIRFEVCSAENEVVAMITANGLTEETIFHGKHKIEFTIDTCQLTTGWYYVNAIAVNDSVRLDTWQRAAEVRVLLKNEDARNLTSDCGLIVFQGHWKVD